MWKILSRIERGLEQSPKLQRLRRDECGIATTEAVIVIPFFLIVWMGLITVHHVYEKRLEVQVLSESRAISRAANGCKGDDQDVSPEAGAADDKMEAEHSDESGFLSSIAGDQPFAWTHTSGGLSIVASGIPELYGGPERRVKGSQKFMCNMEPKDGLWDMLVDMMRSALGWE